MMNIPYNIQMSTGVPNVPEQSRVFQQPRMVTQQMQTAPCIYSTNPQDPFKQPCYQFHQEDVYMANHQYQPNPMQNPKSSYLPIFQQTYPNIPTSTNVQTQPNYTILPQNVLDQIRNCMNGTSSIFILPATCHQQASQTAQGNPIHQQTTAQLTNVNPSQPISYPPSFYPYPIPMPIYNSFGQPRVHCSHCWQNRQATGKGYPHGCCCHMLKVEEEHHCTPTDDDTICSKRNCPASISLQALASQFLTLPGIISCCATRLILRRIPGSNITTTMEETMEKAQMCLNTLNKEQLLSEARSAQQLNALINLHMTTNPPANIIPLLTLVQVKVNVLKAQVESLINKKVMECQGYGYEVETAGPIDPAVLCTKTNEELRHLLAVLRQKETDEQLNVNYSPYSSQRVIAESRLITVRAKIRQVEMEFDRRRSVAIPLPLPTLTSRAIQQFSESRCMFGIADAHLFEPYVQGKIFESPDPFSHCPRSHKKLCLQPREYFQDSVCIRRNVKIKDTSDTGTAMHKDTGTGESGAKSTKEKGVESKSSVEICTCETTSSEESIDEDKKKLQLNIDQKGNAYNVKCASLLKLPPHIVTRVEVCKAGELKEMRKEKEETDERAKDDEIEKVCEVKPIDTKIARSRETSKIENEVKMLRIEKKSEIIGPIQINIKSRESVRTCKTSKTDVSKKKVFDCKYISIKEPEESEEHDKKKIFHIIKERRKESQKTKKVTSEPNLEVESIEKDDKDVSIKDEPIEKTTKASENDVLKKMVLDYKYIFIKGPEESEEHDKKKIFHAIKERRKKSQKAKKITSEPKLELESIEKDGTDVSIKNEPVEKTSKASEIEVSKKQVLDCKYISIKEPEESEEHDKKKIFHVIKERRKESQKTKKITSEPKLELENIEKNDADISIKDEPITKTNKTNEIEISKKQVDCKYISIKEPEESEEHDKKKIFHAIKERRKKDQKTKKTTSEPKLELESIEKNNGDISIKDEPIAKTNKANEIEVSKKQMLDCKYISIKEPEESEEHDKKKIFHLIKERKKESQKTKKVTSEPKLELESIEKDGADVSIKNESVEKTSKASETDVLKKMVLDYKYIFIKEPEESEEHDKKKIFHVIKERRKESQKTKKVTSEPKLELESIEKDDADVSIKNESVEKTSKASETDVLKKMVLDYKYIFIKEPEESEEHDKKKIFHIIKERTKKSQKTKKVTSEPKLELESIEKDDTDVAIKDEPIKEISETDMLKKKMLDYTYIMEPEESDEDNKKKIFHVIKERKKESKRKKEFTSDRTKLELENLEKDDTDVSIKDESVEKIKFPYFPFKKLEKLKKSISFSTYTPDKENAKDDEVAKDDEIAKDDEVAKDDEIEKDEHNEFEKTKKNAKKKNVQFVSTMTHIKYDKNFGDFYGWDIKDYSVQTTENRCKENVECDSLKDVSKENETEDDDVYFLSKKENCSIVSGSQKCESIVPTVSTSIEMSNKFEKCTIAEKMFPKNCRINDEKRVNGLKQFPPLKYAHQKIAEATETNISDNTVHEKESNSSKIVCDRSSSYHSISRMENNIISVIFSRIENRFASFNSLLRNIPNFYDILSNFHFHKLSSNTHDKNIQHSNRQITRNKNKKSQKDDWILLPSNAYSDHKCDTSDGNRISVGEQCDNVRLVKHSIIVDEEKKNYLLITGSVNNQFRQLLKNGFEQPYYTRRSIVIRSRLKNSKNSKQEHVHPFTIFKRIKKNKIDMSQAPSCIEHHLETREKLLVLPRIPEDIQSLSNSEHRDEFVAIFKNEIMQRNSNSDTTINYSNVSNDYSSTENEVMKNFSEKF